MQDSMFKHRLDLLLIHIIIIIIMILLKHYEQ